MGLTSKLGFIFAAIVITGQCVNALPDLECPEDCDCHYFRVNWVTDCSDSNLTEVPHEGLSQNVYILNMNTNGLKELNSFPEDIKLRRLQLSDNKLTKISRESFAGLAYLLDADFSGNHITSVDPDAFRDSPGLITIELQENPLEPVEGPFLSTRSLKYLDISDCHLTILNPQFFVNTTSLNKLDLSGNPLGKIETGILDPLISLEYLQLNRCNLTHIDDMAFASVTNLKSLELAENYLTNVQWSVVLKSLSLLDFLDLRKTALNNLPENAFDNNNWLRSLVLAQNELRDLDVATTLGHNLRQLDSLDLSNCHLKGPLSEDAFANATKLRTLILSGNYLSAGDLSVALAPLTKLHKLSLKNCGLTRLPSNTFHRLSALVELDISSNPLNDAFTGILSPLETLEILDMGYSNLSYISRGTFSKMSHLRRLVLSGNRITDLESGLFQNLTQLRVLELNNCDLTRIPEEHVFSDNVYEDFQELHISGNPLVVREAEPLLPHQLSSVRVLDMSNCRLNNIPTDAFISTPKIVNLKLSENDIATQDMEFINQLPQLETLDLRNCNLRQISPNLFTNIKNLTSLKLAGNPWRCDCYIVQLWEWASRGRGNLGVLVGSTTSPEDITPKSNKRKKGLLCQYEHKSIASPKNPSRIRLHSNRTWARYVRESGCASTSSLKLERLVADQSMQRSSYFVEDSPPTWIIALACASIFIFLTASVATGMAFVLRMRKKEKPDKYGRTSKDIESIDGGKESDLISKRKRSLKVI